MSGELKKREEMDPKYQWRLEDVFADDALFEKELNDLTGEIGGLKRFEGRVAEDPKAAIRAWWALMKRVETAYSYAMMRHDEDGSNGKYTAYLGRVQALAAGFDAAGAFLTPELLKMPEDALRALQDDPDFTDYSAYLRGVIRSRAHTLPPEQEKLLAMAGESLETPSNAFGMLSDVELPFPMVRDESGEETRLSHGKYQSLLRSRDREVRAAAFRGMHNAYRDFGNTFAALYSGSVKRHVFYAQARQYENALTSALDPDEVPTSVYENLIAEIDAALPTLDRYLAIRKRLLGVDELHMYDLYVPMFENVDFPVDYEGAKRLVLDALRPMGEEYTGVLRRAFAEGWVDVYENKAKRSGAYSNGVYGVHPFVLMNFENNLDSVSTLAHELGHSMHSWYSDGAQPYPKAGYSLFVAEVASTCNEVLLNAYLRDVHRDDPSMIRLLLNDLLESFRTTVIRQTMFAAFEKEVHELAEKGEPLTKEALSERYLALNQHYYGRVCVVDEEIGAEYATSFSAAVSIADRILREGEPAVRDHIRFLSAGGSVPPIEALKIDGVDMSDPEPVRRAMRVFADTVDSLEKLL